ncbi:MAG: transposase, partial [Acetobacteraceae bacterium]|nr:transposase [Acetobacteraceae bacterium]
MPRPVARVEVVAGRERRRRCGAEEEVRLVEGTARPGMTVPAVARLHGVPPSSLFGRRRRMAEGGLGRSGRTKASSRPAASASPRPRPAGWSACSAARRWRLRSSARRWSRPAPKNSRCACRRRHRRRSASRPNPGEDRDRHPRRGQVELGGPAPASRLGPPRPIPPG